MQVNNTDDFLLTMIEQVSAEVRLMAACQDEEIYSSDPADHALFDDERVARILADAGISPQNTVGRRPAPRSPLGRKGWDRILGKHEERATRAKQVRRPWTSVAILSRCAAAFLLIVTFVSIANSTEFFNPIINNLLSYLSGTRNRRELKGHRVPEPIPSEDGDAASGDEQMVSTSKADVPEPKPRGGGDAGSRAEHVAQKPKADVPEPKPRGGGDAGSRAELQAQRPKGIGAPETDGSSAEPDGNPDNAVSTHAGVNRYGIVTIHNKTYRSIKYSYRISNGPWRQQSIEPGHFRYFYHRYAFPGENKSPPFEIRFDEDLGSGVVRKQYRLKRCPAPSPNPDFGKQYEFKESEGNRIVFVAR